LESLTFEEFLTLTQGWLKSGRMLWYVTGNIDKQPSIQMVENAKRVFQFRAAEKDDLSDIRCI